MKVLNLRCPSDHIFEGWFGSEDDFVRQQAQGWLQCPLCGSADIAKGLSAPRLHRKSNTASASVSGSAVSARSEEAPQPKDEPGVELQQAMQKAWMAFSRHVVATTEDVGATFADEARKMHAGDVEERAIRGTATQQERRALAEDGIAVLPLAIADAAKHSLQ